MSSQLTKPKKKALFREGDVPPGGTCVSTFVIASNDGKLLAGKVRRPEIWVDRFYVGEKFAPDLEASGKYVLPGSHLAWYESPLDAAARIMNDQLQIDYPQEKLRLMGVQSHLSGEPTDEANPPHWDLCMVYEAKLSPKQAKALKNLEWFEDLGFKPLAKLAPEDFTRGHGDVLLATGLLNKKSKPAKKAAAKKKPRKR